MVIPTIVYAIAILLFFSKLGIGGSFPGFVLAHRVLATPYVVLIVSAALYRFDASTELAALSLGASRVRAIWHVTLPASARRWRPARIRLPDLVRRCNGVLLPRQSQGRHVPRKMFENLQFFMSPVLAVVATLLQCWARARGAPNGCAWRSGGYAGQDRGATWRWPANRG